MLSKLIALLALPVLASAGTIVQTGYFGGSHSGAFWPLDHFVSGQRLTHVEAAFHLTYGWGVDVIFETEPGIPLDPPALVVSEGRIGVGSLIIPDGTSLHFDKRCEYQLTETQYGYLPRCEGEADFIVVGDPSWDLWSTFDDPPIPYFGLTAAYGDAWCEPGGYLICATSAGIRQFGSSWVDYTLTYTYVDPSVPEPGTGALALLSAAFLALRAWQRRR